MDDTCRIVVGVDGSEDSARALRWAVQEATRRGCAVQAILAFDHRIVDSLLSVAATASRTEAHEWARERAEQTLAEAVAAVATVHPGAVIASEVIEGASPAKVLAEAARDADLLAVGSHGRGRLYHAALGSVAEESVRIATCPVVVIPVPQDQRVSRPAEIQLVE